VASVPQAETVENPEKLFLEQLDTIDRVIRFACSRGGFRDDEADDFASYVKLKFIENDYAVIRKYQQRASFAAFASVVVQRFLLDYRIAQWGKWHASAEAKRIGEPAITIEAMLYRDGRSMDEVFPTLVRRWPGLTRETTNAIARRLPPRMARPRAVSLDTELPATEADALSPFAAERLELSQRVAWIVRDAIKDFDERDRLIFRLRFEGGMSVADVSRTLKIEQKPLYRRLQRALATLRKLLESAGVSSADAEDILTDRNSDLDFGFSGEFVGHAGPSASEEER
jgi:RNA polymerase sigma factor (sigma-70 family)